MLLAGRECCLVYTRGASRTIAVERTITPSSPDGEKYPKFCKSCLLVFPRHDAFFNRCFNLECTELFDSAVICILENVVRNLDLCSFAVAATTFLIFLRLSVLTSLLSRHPRTPPWVLLPRIQHSRKNVGSLATNQESSLCAARGSSVGRSTRRCVVCFYPFIRRNRKDGSNNERRISPSSAGNYSSHCR